MNQFETSPEEALTALEMGLALTLSDGRRFWKTPDGIYHCDDYPLFARLAPFLADMGGDLTSSDLFSLLVVLTFRGASVEPVESGGEQWIETTVEEQHADEEEVSA